MTVDELLEHLRGLPSVVLHPGADENEVAAVERQYGIRLPEFHLGLLLKSNGIEADDGYLRLFGVGGNAAIDIGWWNEPHLWKFSWPPWVSDYLCFAETGSGSQLVLSLSDLAAGDPDPPIHLVHGEFQTLRSGPSFSEYLFGGFLANARGDLDRSEAAVRKRLRALDPSEHVVYSPPRPVSNDWKAKHAMKMPAAMAMIINGDVGREYDRISRGGTYFGFTIVAVEPYVDDQGRPRMRLVSDEDVRAGRG